MRAVMARRKLATGLPLGVKRRSGSSVRLPVMVTCLSAMAAASLAVEGISWADRDGQGSGPHLLGPVGVQEPEVPAVLVVQGPGHSAAQLQPVLLELPHALPPVLPAGRARLLARPGRPGLSGPPG